MANESKIYNINDRSFYLYGDINEENTSNANVELIKTLKELILQSAQQRNFDIGHINIFIQSYGGSVEDMWGLVDLMLISPIPIVTYAIGHVESAALNIFLAGSYRYVTKHTSLMYHQLSAGNYEKYQELREWQDGLEKEQDKIEKFVKERTFMKAKKLNEIREKKLNFVMDANEAVELGFATKILDITDWKNILI